MTGDTVRMQHRDGYLRNKLRPHHQAAGANFRVASGGNRAKTHKSEDLSRQLTNGSVFQTLRTAFA
jgi:hypothetical protein